MANLTNTFEGGSNDTDLTGGVAGNTGGTSGSYFDTITKGADGIVKFSTTQARGVYAAKIATRSTAAAANLAWSTQYTALATDYGRVYLRMDARPTSTHWFAQFLSSTSVLQGGIQIQTTGKLRLFDSIAGLSTDSTFALLAATYYRLEWKFTVGVSLVVRIYDGDSGLLIEEVTRTQTGAANLDELRIGLLTTLANLPTSTGFYFIDNIVSGAATWPGAVEQVARPVADVSLGNWTNQAGSVTNIYASIDELAVDNTDFVRSGLSPSTADIYKYRFAPMADPETGEGHTVSVTYSKDTAAGDRVDLTVKLMRADGTTLVRSQTFTDIPAAWTLGEFTLTVAEADSIPAADYATGLVLQLEAVKV